MFKNIKKFTAITLGAIILGMTPVASYAQEQVCQTREVVMDQAASLDLTLERELGLAETITLKTAIEELFMDGQPLNFPEWKTTMIFPTVDANGEMNDEVKIVIQFDGEGCVIKSFQRPGLEIQLLLEYAFGREVKNVE